MLPEKVGKDGRMLLRHPILSLLTLGYLAVVGWLTLGPQPIDDDGRSALLGLVRRLQQNEATSWVTYSGIEFTANILMFVPVGLLFVLIFGRRGWWAAILLGVMLTVGIEATQLFLHDRVTDARDVVANSLGAAIGVVFALVVTWPKARQIRRESRTVTA